MLRISYTMFVFPEKVRYFVLKVETVCVKLLG